METNELISRISRADITADERLEALGEIMKKVSSGEIETPERGIFVNNHIHTSYSFSPYTPTSTKECTPMQLTPKTERKYERYDRYA